MSGSPSQDLRLEYGRGALPPGSRLEPCGADPELVRTLIDARRVTVHAGFGKVGDSLLSLSVATACLDALRLIRPHDPPEFVLRTPHPGLLELAQWGDGTFDVTVGRGEAAGSDRLVFEGMTGNLPEAEWSYSFWFRPYPRVVEPTPLGERVHASLPARLYLAFERSLGVALGRDPSRCLPWFRGELSGDPISGDPNEVRVAVVATCGWARKQFGVARYLDALGRLARLYRNRHFTIDLFVSPSRDELDVEAQASIARFPGWVAVVDGADLSSLARRLAEADAAVGNDTGLSHLAAMTVSSRTGCPLPTTMVYFHVDPTFWTTGGRNAISLTSPYARLLAVSRSPLVSAGAHRSAWGRHAEAGSVSENAVFNAVERALLNRNLL